MANVKHKLVKETTEFGAGDLGQIVGLKVPVDDAYGKRVGDVFLAGYLQTVFLRDGGIIDKDSVYKAFSIRKFSSGELVTLEQV
jgi:hypothetical protein